MFYDLNVPWTTGSAQNSQLPRTLHFLHELGYDAVALNHSIAGKLPSDVTNPILSSLATLTPQLPPKLQIKTRLTFTLLESPSNARLAEVARPYDLLALRPTDERTLSLACSSLDCDIISLDLTARLPFWFRYKMFKEAIAAGKKVEICYAQALQPSSTSSSNGIGGVSGGKTSGGGGGGGGSGTNDPAARRNLISNATQLIRATRGRGILLSSEARSALACRGPWDVVNLAAVWGLPAERGAESLRREPRSLLVAAELKKRGFRGVVDLVSGTSLPSTSAAADGPASVIEKGDQQQQPSEKSQGRKRKAEMVMENGDSIDSSGVVESEQPISKRQMKRQQKAARLNGEPVDGSAVHEVNGSKGKASE